jgi:hypothetical protein
MPPSVVFTRSFREGFWVSNTSSQTRLPARTKGVDSQKE